MGTFLRHIFVAAVLSAGLLSCVGGGNGGSGTPETVDGCTVEKGPVPALLELSLEQKIGQMFIVAPEKLSPSARTAVTEEMRAAFARIPVGGFCLFAPNIVDPAQITAFTADMHSLGAYPLISVDEEGGRVSRFDGNPAFKVPHYESMYHIGSGEDAGTAFNVGISIGGYLRRYGFDLDFAPVADVFTNPANTVIGKRAFSSDPETAAAMMCRCMQGLRLSGVEACLKHFPGHGDTATDSHLGCAETRKSWAQMQECELIPFKRGIAAGARMIMVGHITCPEVTHDRLPASLSPEMIGRLRDELHFNGLIITDALGMGAVSSQYDSAEAAVKAVEAGVDVLLLPKDLESAYNALLDAVRSGHIPESRIDRSVGKILNLKRDLCR